MPGIELTQHRDCFRACSQVDNFRDSHHSMDLVDLSFIGQVAVDLPVADFVGQCRSGCHRSTSCGSFGSGRCRSDRGSLGYRVSGLCGLYEALVAIDYMDLHAVSQTGVYLVDLPGVDLVNQVAVNLLDLPKVVLSVSD